MKHYLILFILILGTAWGLSAQQISGKATLYDGKPAEYATITLHKAQDSTVVKGAISGDDGSFEIEGATPDRYFIRVSTLGLGEGNSPIFEYQGKNMQLETLVLTEATAQLSQVTVTARRPVIEVQADKTVLNVEGTVNSTGLSAIELLRKAPGVTVDNNDNVSIKGKNAVKVMIDGRDVPLDGRDLAQLLKGTQASDIAQIEIISNPSAKFDASGNAGIINIKMRKNKSLGTNGNVSIEGISGETFKGGGSARINNRGKKIGSFISYNNHFGRWHNTNDFVREQSGQKFDQLSASYFESRWNSGRAGLDWFVNDRHTLGVLLNANFEDGSWHSQSNTKISNLTSPTQIDSFLIATNDQVPAQNHNYNLNFNYRFADTSGHTLNIDLDQGRYRMRSRTVQPNLYQLADGTLLPSSVTYRNNTPTDIDIMTAKADYEQNLLKGKLNVGGKIAVVDTDNTFDFFKEIEQVPVLDTNQSNRFIYEERTLAGFINYNRSFGKKLFIQAGLRVENTNYSGDLNSYKIQGDTSVVNDYTKLFPSAAVTYQITDKIGLNANYSRRIDRPSYQDLNPFENKIDELTFQKGNPMLRPQFTHNFEISPTYGGYPIVALGYSHTNDVFTQVLKTDQRNPKATFVTQENLATQDNWSMSVNIPTPIAKWWEGFVSLTGWQSHFKADFGEGFAIDQEYRAFNVYAEQTYKLPRDWSIQLSGWYNSRSFWGTMQSDPQGSVDLGVQKKVLKGNGELRFRAGDIFRTAGWSGENTLTPGLRMTALGTWEADTYTLSFNYRFGNNEIKGARQRKTGLEDEGKRVKSGRG
jgi:iron complex outermembrane receptor protein